MTPEYAVGLLGLAASICAAVALFWALHRRQLRTDDQTMYEALVDDEPDFTSIAPSTSVTRRYRQLFTLAFAAMFGLIAWMIVQTVRVASQGQAAPTTTRSTRPVE